MKPGMVDDPVEELRIADRSHNLQGFGLVLLVVIDLAICKALVWFCWLYPMVDSISIAGGRLPGDRFRSSQGRYMIGSQVSVLSFTKLAGHRTVTAVVTSVTAAEVVGVTVIVASVVVEVIVA